MLPIIDKEAVAVLSLFTIPNEYQLQLLKLSFLIIEEFPKESEEKQFTGKIIDSAKKYGEEGLRGLNSIQIAFSTSHALHLLIADLSQNLLPHKNPLIFVLALQLGFAVILTNAAAGGTERLIQ